MNTNGEAADLMIRESIQITESAVKLAGIGAKNLAALLIALANDNQKMAGKAALKRFLKDGDPISIFSIKPEDLSRFHTECRKYGALFHPIVNKAEKTGTIEILAKTKDAAQINHILAHLGYPAPVSAEPPKKNRDPSEHSFGKHENGANNMPPDGTPMKNPSMAERLKAAKTRSQTTRRKDEKKLLSHSSHTR